MIAAGWRVARDVSSLPADRVAAAMAFALAGCAAPGPAPCPLASQRPMTVATLLFGRDIPERAALTDTEWARFAAAEVTPRFPDGFTAIDGEGQWRDPASGRIDLEPSKIVVIAANPAPDLGPRLTAVIEAYKTRFHQQSVGLLTAPACGAF